MLVYSVCFQEERTRNHRSDPIGLGDRVLSMSAHAYQTKTKATTETATAAATTTTLGKGKQSHDGLRTRQLRRPGGPLPNQGDVCTALEPARAPGRASSSLKHPALTISCDTLFFSAVNQENCSCKQEFV